MTRTINFSAGPATLPESVLATAQQEMLNWRGTGMSVMEMSHRSPEFMQLRDETEQALRELMNIPTNYQVLFLPGGARSQFAMLPMNLLAQNHAANYLVTGRWSDLAYHEAQQFGDIHLAASSADDNFKSIPDSSQWQLNDDAAYCYYTPNETILGVEFQQVPEVPMPLVADMTSCILSRQYNVEQFGVIFAAAQKNLGQAGVTVVIIRDDLIQQPLAQTPSMFDYRLHRDHKSLYNTVPTYAIYIMSLVLKDLQAKGGVAAIEKINASKAALLYSMIDESDFYQAVVDKAYRSTMNVSFVLPSKDLEQQFLTDASAQGFFGLKGHSSVGGIRASLYNAMPLASVERLCQFMADFSQKVIA